MIVLDSLTTLSDLMMEEIMNEHTRPLSEAERDLSNFLFELYQPGREPSAHSRLTDDQARALSGNPDRLFELATILVRVLKEKASTCGRSTVPPSRFCGIATWAI